MNDHEFLTAFENGTLPDHEFPHRAHIRMAWLYLRRDGWEQGTQRIRAGIQHFAAAHGAQKKYHDTITLFWARLVHHALTSSPEITEFESFIQAYPHLLDKTLIERHYSLERLWSDAARQGWVEPDKLPLPALAAE